MRLARVLAAAGRTLITAGVLILLFVAYQLWGTGIREAQAQNRLEDDFAQALEAAQDQPTSPELVDDTTAEPVPAGLLPLPQPGEPVGRIEIPAIEVDKIIVQGVSLVELKSGPGHYPETPLPGQEGNVGIAGHRTTYGAPFHRIDELVPGDEIIVETVQGRFAYEVMDPPHIIVSPTDVWVLDDFGDNRITLTACHPKYSARQRIIVSARLVGDALPLQPAEHQEDAPAPAALDDIDGEGAPAWPAILLGVVCAAIWLAAWLLGRVWIRWPAYALGLPVFLLALFFFFEEFSRLLPASY